MILEGSDGTFHTLKKKYLSSYLSRESHCKSCLVLGRHGGYPTSLLLSVRSLEGAKLMDSLCTRKQHSEKESRFYNGQFCTHMPPTNTS